MNATTLRILIVDDEQPARARMRELLSDCRGEVSHLVVGEAANGFEALEAIAGMDPDMAPTLLLVDIHMPGMTGIELARHVQRFSAPPAVVFVTAHDQYAVAAFELNAVDYLLKPVRSARLAAALKKVAAGGTPAPAVFDRLDPQPRRHFSVAERGRVLLVPVNDVLFMKADQKYVALVTKEREYLIEDSLNSLEEEFASLFIRVHRSTLVGRRWLRGVERFGADRVEKAEEGEGGASGEGWGVIVEGWKELLPVSRRQWPQVKAMLKT
jgi:two-component system response regulator AlgR